MELVVEKEVAAIIVSEEEEIAAMIVAKETKIKKSRLTVVCFFGVAIPLSAPPHGASPRGATSRRISRRSSTRCSSTRRSLAPDSSFSSSFSSYLIVVCVC